MQSLETLIETLFCGDYQELFEVIDDDMIRKPAVRVQKVKTYENGQEDYKVTVNRRLLKKWNKEEQ